MDTVAVIITSEGATAADASTSDIPTLLEMARVAINVRQITAARQTLFRVLERDPGNAEAWQLMSRVASSPGAAKIYLQHALALDPTNAALSTEVARKARQERLAQWGIPLAYLAAVTAGEAVTVFLSPAVGLAVHGALLVALLGLAATAKFAHWWRLLLAMALPPLLRLLSLSLPLYAFPQIYWYLIIGVPVFFACGMVVRLGNSTREDLGLRLSLRTLPLQLLVGLTGILIGYAEYMLLRPAPLVTALSIEQLWLPALILAFFTGFLEEFLFRGVLQSAAIERLGRVTGVVGVAALFAIFHFGTQSPAAIGLIFVVGLYFGAALLYTRSLIGVTLAHALANISLLLVLPLLFPS
jgi:hypothetical protein